MEQQLIKDKSTQVLTSFFGLENDEDEINVVIDKFSIELISDALSQSLVKGKKKDEIKN